MVPYTFVCVTVITDKTGLTVWVCRKHRFSEVMSKVKANAHVTAMPVTAGAPKVSTTEIAEELLLCRLCSSKYRVVGRRPLTLRCAHTFCELCLEGMLDDDDATTTTTDRRRNRRQQLACPTCDAITPFGRGSTPSSSLPVNHSVMELLELLDRPTSGGAGGGGRHEPRSDVAAPGFSQVKVGTKTPSSHVANGCVNADPANRTLMAQAKTKKHRRSGMDPAGRYLPGDGGRVDEAGGGPSSPMNWVSTVNIRKSSSQQQQQQQQQQQHGSSFAAGKLSSVPAAVTSAVTSVSTLKHPSTTSSGVVESTAVPTPAGTHRCCRCGVRPATVSVASSSQTMAPQRLCSDCWKQPRNVDDEDRKRSAAEQTAATITGSKPPENGARITARISTTKTDVRSGGGAPAALPLSLIHI